MYYNRKMGGFDTMDQQLQGIQVLRKTYKGYHKIFFRIPMMGMLSAQKIYKKEGGSIDFLQFVHDVVLNLLSHAPLLPTMPRRFPVDSFGEAYRKAFPRASGVSRFCNQKKACTKEVQSVFSKAEEDSGWTSNKVSVAMSTVSWQTRTMPRRMFSKC